MRATILPILWTVFTAGISVSNSQDSVILHDTAILRWLDKVAARVVTIEVPVGQTFRITGSTLQVIVHTCVTRPRTEIPESAAFLEIWEIKPVESSVEVFQGWMFSFHSAFSAMEHPTYDVWLLTCQGNNVGVDFYRSSLPVPYRHC